MRLPVAAFFFCTGRHCAADGVALMQHTSAQTMPLSDIQYLPVTAAFFLILLGALVVLFLLVVFRVLRYAYGAMGIAPQYFFLVLLLTLIGSYINIPLLRFPEAQVLAGQVVIVFGVPYIVPVVHESPGS